MAAVTSSTRHRAGFTLLEILIAVVIIAVVGVSISSSIGTATSQTFTLERRSVANWVAMNQLTRLQIEDRNPANTLELGKKSRRITMGNREWVVRTEVTTTEMPLIRRIEVAVYEFSEGEELGPYETMYGFVGS